MDNLKIFLVHGRDVEAVNEVKNWFVRRRKLAVDLIAFSDHAIPGETIPAELERLASQGDAAIILVTPDDVGGLDGSTTLSRRARENVWLELGWFWARLGRARTLMLVKGSVDKPSDTSGVLYVAYNNKLSEVSTQLTSFVESVASDRPSVVTEVLSSGTDAGDRSAAYRLVTDQARHKVIIMGVGMANVRHDLEHIFSSMEATRQDLDLIFLTPSLDIVSRSMTVLDSVYRSDLVRDLEAFEDALRQLSGKYSSIRNRVRHCRSEIPFTFSATVAEPGSLGSLMLVETILPASGYHAMERPRLLLRKRTRDGLYDRFNAAILNFVDNAKCDNL